jgi:hypothetical protein
MPDKLPIDVGKTRHLTSDRLEICARDWLLGFRRAQGIGTRHGANQERAARVLLTLIPARIVQRPDKLPIDLGKARQLGQYPSPSVHAGYMTRAVVTARRSAIDLLWLGRARASGRGPEQNRETSCCPRPGKKLCRTPAAHPQWSQ